MKKLGIIGGAGPLASALFYETLVHESYRVQKKLPELLLLNYPFTRGLTPCEKKMQSSLIREELLHCLNTLSKGDATHAILVCNTLHLELANIPLGSLQFVEIPHCVLEEIKEKKGKHLLLLGTQNTCLSSLYHKKDLNIFTPSIENQEIVDQVINRVLEGTLSKWDSYLLEKIIRNCSEPIDGVILGCTELPVLHHHFPIQTLVPIYDSVKIPAKTILRSL